MKNITFVITSLKAHGGTERVMTFLANELSAKYKINIINRDTKKEDSAFFINHEVEVKVFSGSLFSFYSQLRNYLNSNPNNLVIVHNMGKLSLFVALLFAKNEMWTYEHVAKSSRGFGIKVLSKILYRKYSKIITLTKSDALSYKSYNTEIVTLNNPSPYNVYYDYDPASKMVIAIGRLTYQKGFDDLIDAWTMISKRYPDWNLSIYGDGEDRQLLQNQIKKNKLNNVFLYPVTTDIDVIYKKASFLVMSSRYEGFGMVLAEAQTFSLPTISFDCPFGPSEIITNGKDGLLVENQNIKKLADAMECLIANRGKRILFSKNAAKSAQRFSKKDIISQWEKLIDNHLDI